MHTLPDQPVRHVVLLPAGRARALAFDNLGVELGNGWLDITARVAAAPPEAWLPPLAWQPTLRRAARFPALGKAGRPAERMPDQMLTDDVRDPFGTLRAGTIMRDSSTVGDPPVAYWIYADGWWPARVIDLRPRERPPAPEPAAP